VVEETGYDAGEEVEGLEDAVEREEDHDAGEEEGDCATPGYAVDGGIPVFR